MTDSPLATSAEQCPFDLPRNQIGENLFEVCQMGISTLYLERIQTYRGHCVLVFDPRHVTRIDELTATEWQQQADDIYKTEKAIMNAFSPDHINIASIGQMVPHLHWHIIPRYQTDPRWGGPIWMTDPGEQVVEKLADVEYEQLAAALKTHL
ncbi:MAG: HIT family protein [Woeseiaceae bacterium]